MHSGIIFLTSTGLSSEAVAQKFKNLISFPEMKAAAIITTAAEDKEKNKYSQLAKKQFEGFGFTTVDFVDLETDPAKDLSSYRVIYVCGGNTFKLLKFAREANFKASIENLLRRGGVYIGVSAGSIIVGPSIKIAGEIEPDPNDVGLEDLTGLNVISFIILPHYSFELEGEVKSFEVKYGVSVERLSDIQAVLIEDGQKTVIE